MTRAGGEKEGVPRVAVAVIGDEVLLGEVEDQNLPFLARGIAAAGADLSYSCVLPDRMEFLVEHLGWMAGRFDAVIATGGIGATHDDLTREAAAAVLGVPLEEHPGAVRAMEEGFGGPLRPKVREMARLPRGARLIPNPVTFAPGFAGGNLFVLPGIPELVRAMWPAVAPLLAGTALHREELVTRRWESEIADPLAEAARRFPSVKMGSYPVRHQEGWRVRIVLRSRRPEELEEAVEVVKGFLKEGEGK